MAGSRERLGILISGGGTTMQEIGRASLSGKLPWEIGIVISSDPQAKGIGRAQDLGFKTAIIDPNSFKGDNGKVDQDEYGYAMVTEFRSRGVKRVSQNGFMPMTPDVLIDEYDDEITNQHPALLPDFGGRGMYGKRPHAAILAFRRLTKATKEEMWTEATVQKVSKGQYDAGAIYANSERVPILSDDEVDDLQQRVLPVEHRVQVNMLKDAAAGKLVEVKRESIVKPGQEIFLEYAKKIAIVLYPHG